MNKYTSHIPPRGDCARTGTDIYLVTAVAVTIIVKYDPRFTL
jgi:hypothetical protein